MTLGDAAVELPLFPLGSVLFPDGLLELKIFEARYLDLMSRCMRESTPFGVVGLKSGREVKGAGGVELFEVGTTAELIDVDSASTGILLVRCRGGKRFTLEATRQEPDGLWVGAVSAIDGDAAVAPSSSQADIVKSLVEAIAALAAQGARPFLEPHRFDDAGWVANRWCEILPLPVEAKQRLLTLMDPVARLDVVESLMRVKRDDH
ncbi:MAG: LON peptidase substrate-binding domain-containing protein [Caldimonas sp.]